jgi:alkylhydroperoxidase family enzyme
VRTAALAALLLAAATRPVAAGDQPRLPAPPDAEAWAHLPAEKPPPLPVWARALAPSLPKTTARMLELDYAHRAQSPLGPVLRGKLRWVAADANRCAYARQYAGADLRRAGLADADPKALAGDHAGLPAAERAALAFARKLTLAGHAITDEEVAELIGHYGPARVVAIVHTVAYANFQDRVLLALGAEVEPGGPLPPAATRFDPDAKPGRPAPPRPPWKEVAGAKADPDDARPVWSGHSFDDLRALLDRQKARPSRVPMPDAAALAGLPPPMRAQAERVVWTRVSGGYQPGLTAAWFACMAAAGEEAALDRVFANTLFWVVTRTNDCFY